MRVISVNDFEIRSFSGSRPCQQNSLTQEATGSHPVSVRDSRFFHTAFILLMLFLLSLFLVSCRHNTQKTVENEKTEAHNPAFNGTAIVITGAAARIPQEAALLEKLDQMGEFHNVVIITGASSGAINTVMLNAILNKTLTWERYKKLLFSISNEQVFIDKARGLPLDTSPLRSLLNRIINDSLGYRKIGDLPIPSALSATNMEIIPLKERTYRFCNLKINPESNPEFDLVDILMASTSIPVVFPPVRLNVPDSDHVVSFIDGGVADDHVPFQAVVQYEQFTGMKVDKMIIVSRKNNHDSDVEAELHDMGLKDTKLLEKLGVSIQRFSHEGFINRLIYLQKTYPDLASRTYIYIPDSLPFFPMLNFNTLEEQYHVTTSWAESHKPLLLDKYLSDIDK